MEQCKVSKRSKALMLENNELEKSVSGEGAAVLTDIVVYLRSSGLSGYDQELVRRDITQMLIDGERRGESARDVIGEDYQQFCDSVIAEFPRPGLKQRVMAALRDFMLYAAVLLTIKAVFSLITLLLSPELRYRIVITLGDALSAAMILAAAVGIVTYICRNSFSTEKHGSWQAFAVLFVIVFAILCAAIFIRRPLFEINIALFALLPIVCFIVYKALDSRID